MLNESKNIDQLFKEKLGEYEKTPPMYLLTNIQGRLNAGRKERRFARLKTISVAAAIVLAFLAGWWMTNPTNKVDIPQNKIADHQDDNIKRDQLANDKTTAADEHTANSEKNTTGTVEIHPKALHSSATNLSSLATFAANTTLPGKNNVSTTQETKDLVLFNSEKEFTDKLHHDFKIVKKLADWISAINTDTTPTYKSSSKPAIINPYNPPSPDKSVTFAMNKPLRNSGRWSIKAEFAPVFNNQAPTGGSGGELLYSSTQSYKPQKSKAENTFSGGMVAGYKVGKRLTIKSGFIYNNLRQTTQNADFTSANLLYNVAGKSSLVSTPVGQVHLDKMINTRIGAILNSDNQLSYTANSSAENMLKQDIGFVEIPVQATYKLINKKIAVGLTGGISTNILVGNKANLLQNGENISTGETSNMRNVVYSGAIGFEIGYEITNRITLTVEPRIKQFINSLSTNKSVNYRPSQMGIVTGLTYSFN